MATYNMHSDEDSKRERIDAAKEEIRSAKQKIAKMEQKIALVDEEEEEVDKVEIAEQILGIAMLIAVGLRVLYRYLVFGFI